MQSPCRCAMSSAPCARAFSSPGADTPEKENHRCHLFHSLRSMIVLGFALVGQLPHIFLKDLSFLASGQAEFWTLWHALTDQTPPQRGPGAFLFLLFVRWRSMQTWRMLPTPLYHSPFDLGTYFRFWISCMTISSSQANERLQHWFTYLPFGSQMVRMWGVHSCFFWAK